MISETDKRAIALQIVGMFGWRKAQQIPGEEWKGQSLSKEELALYEAAVKTLLKSLSEESV